MTPREKAAAASGGFDLDQARAIRRDREGAQFKFTFGGDKFECLPIKEWPIWVTELIAEGKMLDALREVLGDQYDQFAKHDPALGDVEALFNALGEWGGIGTTVGE